MFEPQRLIDMQENSDFLDQKSWLSGGHDSSPTHLLAHPSLANSSGANGNVDRVLFNDLVEIVPLVQSLIDRKASSSFTRRGSVTYTKTPSREALSKKVNDPKGRNATQSFPMKKKRDQGDRDEGKGTNHNADAGGFSIFSSTSLASEKEREELVILKEQVEDLQKKLLEKEELLKSAEISKNEMENVRAKLEALKLQAVEKDSVIKSTQTQLSDAKIKLADKQAALEKVQWEAMTTNRKVEKLQQELKSRIGEISSFMLLLEGLTKNDSDVYIEDYDLSIKQLDHASFIDELGETEMQRVEEARKAYEAAVTSMKQKQDEESIAAAASARLLLQSLVFRSKISNVN